MKLARPRPVSRAQRPRVKRGRATSGLVERVRRKLPTGGQVEREEVRAALLLCTRDRLAPIAAEIKAIHCLNLRSSPARNFAPALLATLIRFPPHSGRQTANETKPIGKSAIVRASRLARRRLAPRPTFNGRIEFVRLADLICCLCSHRSRRQLCHSLCPLRNARERITSKLVLVGRRCSVASPWQCARRSLPSTSTPLASDGHRRKPSLESEPSPNEPLGGLALAGAKLGPTRHLPEPEQRNRLRLPSGRNARPELGEKTHAPGL